MAIVDWPEDISPLTVVNCVICQEPTAAEHATIGMHDTSGHQAFACNKHFKERSLFIGWAEYAFSQSLTEFDTNPWFGENNELLLY